MGKGAGLLSPEVHVSDSDVLVAAPSGVIHAAPIIRGADALQMLKRQVMKKGEDYVYVKREFHGDPKTSMCLNWTMTYNRREPDCIVGHVLADIPDPERGGTALDCVIAQCNAVCAFGTLRRLHIAYATDVAVAVFMQAQRSQDSGKSWGYSLARATLKYIEVKEWMEDTYVVTTT